jgi:hypothetical protein
MKYSKKYKTNKTNKTNKTKNKTNNKTNNKTKKSKKGGLGTFFPTPPKNKEEEIKTLTNDIGRVKLQRIEKSLQLEFDTLKQLRKNCKYGCEIDSCMYKNKENCDTFNKLVNNNNNNNNIEIYCEKLFKNLNCRDYITSYNKMQFYIKYINDINEKCKKMFDDYNYNYNNKA